jgi:hypothetical protein
MKFMPAFYQLLETCLLNWNILYWKDPFVVLELNKIKNMKRWHNEGSTDGIVSQVVFVMHDGYLLLDIRIKTI